MVGNYIVLAQRRLSPFYMDTSVKSVDELGGMVNCVGRIY